MLNQKQRYKLEVGKELHLSKSLANRKTGTSFSIAKKITLMLITALVFLATGIAAITGFTPQAHAVKVDPISDMLCPTVSNGTSYLGGVSQPIINAFNGETGKPPWEGIFGVWSIPKADQENITAGNPVAHEWTTVERYGYFATEYTNWIGMQTHYPLERVIDEVFSDGKLPYLGTGGNPGGFGAFTYIIDGQNSPMFSQNLIDCVPVYSHAMVAAGNTLQTINQAVTALALNFFIMSNNLSLSDDNSMIRPLGEVFEKIIAGDNNSSGLKDLLFLDFLFPLLMIGAIVLIIQYAKNWSALKTLQQVLWMLFILVLGMILLSNPLLISSTVDKIVNTVSSGLSTSMLSSESQSPECKLSSDEPQKAERELACYLWMNNIYNPWVEGQYGTAAGSDPRMKTDPAVKEGVSELGEPDDASTYTGLNASNWSGINRASYSANDVLEDGETIRGSENLLALTALGYDPKAYYPDYESMFSNSKPVGAEPQADGTRGVFSSFDPHLGTRTKITELKNWPYYQMDTSAKWPVSNGYNASEVAYNQLVINNNVYWKNPLNAATASFIAGGYSIIPNIITILFSITLITLQITLSILIIIAPFLLALALIPGFGQRVFYKWANMLLGITVRRIIVSFFFFLYLKIYFIILNVEMSVAIQLLLVAVISIIIFSMREQIASAIINGLQFKKGGDMSKFEKEGYEKALSKTDDATEFIRTIRQERNKDYQRLASNNIKQRRTASSTARKTRRAQRKAANAQSAAAAQPQGNPQTIVTPGGRKRRISTTTQTSQPNPNITTTNPTSQPPLLRTPNTEQPELESGMNVNQKALPQNPTQRPGAGLAKIAPNSFRNNEEWRSHGFQDPNTQEAYFNNEWSATPETAALSRSRSTEAMSKLSNKEKLAAAIYTTQAYGKINQASNQEGNTDNDWFNQTNTNLPQDIDTMIELETRSIADPAEKERKANQIINREAHRIALKQPTPEQLRGISASIESASQKMSGSETDIVFKGESMSSVDNQGKTIEEVMKSYRVGNTAKKTGFSSTSYSANIAADWSRKNSKEGIVFEIKTSTGIALTNIAGSAFFEHESLMSKNKEYLIVGNHMLQRNDGKKVGVVQMVEVDKNNSK